MLLHVDVDRDTGGKDLQEKYPRSLRQGIPWFVCLDADGRELADSNGPKGNIGCPNTDEEIDVFIDILKKVAVAITPEELPLLKKSLVAHREKK